LRNNYKRDNEEGGSMEEEDF